MRRTGGPAVPEAEARITRGRRSLCGAADTGDVQRAAGEGAAAHVAGRARRGPAGG